jgi:hypothetical protein
MNSKSP